MISITACERKGSALRKFCRKDGFLIHKLDAKTISFARHPPVAFAHLQARQGELSAKHSTQRCKLFTARSGVSPPKAVGQNHLQAAAHRKLQDCEQLYQGFTLRPDSWHEREINGRAAVSFTGDFVVLKSPIRTGALAVI